MRPSKKKKALSSRKNGRNYLKEKSPDIPLKEQKTFLTPVNRFLATREIKNGAYLLLASLVLIAGGIFSLPNYHSLLPPGTFLTRLLVHPSLLIAGFLSLTLLFRILPEKEGRSEMPRWQAYLWFTFFFGLCFFSRSYRPEDAAPYFWADQLNDISYVRNIVDFKWRPLLMDTWGCPPFFYYFTAFLWKVFPSASGVWIVRLSSTLIDLGVLWGFYRLGSAVQGRRLGLILMAFWALSLPAMMEARCGYGLNLTVFDCVWTLFLFYRLIQKPTLTYFIYWGLMLAFGEYAFYYFRPWIPTMITVVLLWILFGSKEKPKGAATRLLMVGLWIFWAFLFFYKNNYIPQGPVVDLMVRPWFMGAFIAALLVVYAKTCIEAKGSEADRKVLGWATGAGLTALLISPMMLNPYYSNYVPTISIFHESGKLSVGLASFKLIWLKIIFALESLFSTADPDFCHYPMPGHSCFESFPELAMVVGLAYFIARPSWFKKFIILMSLVGMVIFIFSNQDTTGRLFGAIAPLFLMGGWGLDYFWGLFSGEMKGGAGKKVVFLLFFAFWAWDANWGFSIFQDWMAYKTKNDAIISAQVNEDCKHYQVIIARHSEDFVEPPFSVLGDQKDARLLNDPNPIYLEPGLKGKDIILLLSGKDQATEERVRKEFPQAQWRFIPSLNGPRFMDRILIPFDSLLEVPGKILYVQRVPPAYWRRRFYWDPRPYGIARGLVTCDERVPLLQTGFPPGINEQFTAQADGELTVPIDGEYHFSVNQATDFIVLSIDDKEVMNQEAGFKGEGKVYLKSGVHRVSYKTTFRRAFSFTDILVTPPGGGKEWVLGQPVLDSKP